MTAVAIVGSRRWSDFDAFCEAMPDLSAYDTIVSGGAVGVDAMAEQLARVLGKRFVPYLALQVGGGSFTAAAHTRNQLIVDAADALIAFPGPRSRGTWDTIRRAKKKGMTEENGRLTMRKAAR